jgi:[ribosomal protein S18]-alanine N-acetyltransferase
MSKVSIRAASLRDLDGIFALEQAVFSADRLSRRSLRAFIQSPNRPLLVAIAERSLAGYALVALREGAAAARLYSIAVDPSKGRRGVGRALMAASERYAAAHGRQSLRLEVRSDNHAAIALYERLGFQQFGHYDRYYADGARALRFEKRVRDRVASRPKKKRARPGS